MTPKDYVNRLKGEVKFAEPTNNLIEQITTLPNWEKGHFTGGGCGGPLLFHTAEGVTFRVDREKGRLVRYRQKRKD